MNEQQLTSSQYTHQLRLILNLTSPQCKKARATFEETLENLATQFDRPGIGYFLKNAINSLTSIYYRALLDGTYSLALRDLNAWKTTALIGRLAAECSTHDQARAWLREHRHEFVKDK